VSVPARLNFVTLGVADVEAAAAFYERLGWRRSSGSVPGEIAFFALGPVVLGLYGYAALAEDAALPPADPAAYRGTTLAINVGSEAEVDAVLAAAAEAGATPLKPGTRADWGGYSGYFADPDGNAWEVAFNPGFPLRADGTVELPE
jgi:catechol 2,3-dioxygenase-like lactoylglutathione lyase family enzyme